MIWAEFCQYFEQYYNQRKLTDVKHLELCYEHELEQR